MQSALEAGFAMWAKLLVSIFLSDSQSAVPQKLNFMSNRVLFFVSLLEQQTSKT